jgi:hypothetical protein
MAAEVITGPDDPSRAGATLYSGALGDKSTREHIAKEFHSLHSFFGQRTAIVAVHELPFKPIVYEFVARHLRPDLFGVYTQLKVQKGDYVNPLDPILLGEDTFEEHES